MEKRTLMTERERLIEIFKTTKYKAYECTPETTVANQFSEYALSHIVDEFLKKGIMVSPCKVGDTVYYVECEMVCKGRIDKIEYNLYTEPHMWIEVEYRSPIVGTQITRGRVDLFWNKIIFLTREEAEKVLKERKENA